MKSFTVDVETPAWSDAFWAAAGIAKISMLATRQIRQRSVDGFMRSRPSPDKGEAAGPATHRGARDAALTRTSLVGVLSRPDLDRDRSAARERDETRVNRRRADGRMVGVDVGAEGTAPGGSSGRAAKDEVLAEPAAQRGRRGEPVAPRNGAGGGCGRRSRSQWCSGTRWRSRTCRRAGTRWRAGTGRRHGRAGRRRSRDGACTDGLRGQRWRAG